ncbi:protein C19orf12 homolog [Sitodiplosis mosellana]|uniref:protein C19orf12 homolog n=1 Tax=Sitodiplosis mosellana TaxID=263140 RepID=UPI0024440E2D|nr:protein C19orf12 homolog [Sitodiplosis mosellana]
MPVDVEEFLRGLAILADNQNMRVTLKQSGKGAAICGAICFVGGLVAGPLGLAVGGTIGGVTAYKCLSNFRTVGDIIRNDLTQEEKWRLHEHVVNSVRHLHPTDVAMLMPLIMNTPSLQEAVLKTIVSFVTNEMRYTIANN